ncbi:MAG: ABC transporter ATP-binding protein [Bacteroidaceae bacterium]|nr:ABC transporter ATP-binding protein [Bacteroidaceae bacterium]
MNYELDRLVIGYKQRSVAGPFSAVLHEGELCCLLGPNGAGKSTLLRTLACFQPPLGGRMVLGGEDVRHIPPRKLSTRVGVVLTDRIVTPGITVRDMVAMGRSPYTNYWGRLTAEDHRAVDEAMEQVGVTDFARRQVGTLSDGERQKVMIAKALAQGTPIILLDEPTAFLDYPSKAETMLLLRRLCHEMGKTVLLSTHDLDLALQTADCLWLLKPELPLAIGTPRQLAADGLLERFFQSGPIQFNQQTLRFSIQI